MYFALSKMRAKTSLKYLNPYFEPLTTYFELKFSHIIEKAMNKKNIINFMVAYSFHIAISYLQMRLLKC